MARDKRMRTKGRRDGGSFAALPHVVLHSENFRTLSARAVKLLIDLLSQYRGNNNGDLCCAFRLMAKRGWRSKDQLHKARGELLERGWIILTRQGGLHMGPNLYALTFQALDYCGGKLEVPQTRTAPGDWKHWRPDGNKTAARAAGQADPQGGPESDRPRLSVVRS